MRDRSKWKWREQVVRLWGRVLEHLSPSGKVHAGGLYVVVEERGVIPRKYRPRRK